MDRFWLSPFGWFLLVGLLVWGALFLSLASWESLWLDELHTSWTLEGEWGTLWQRAAAGNQTIGYFVGLIPIRWTVGELGGSAELALRLPSAAASLCCLGLVAWILRYQIRMTGPIVFFVLAWLGLDRLQLFFATEARVYAILQLLNLIGWMLVIQIATRHARSSSACLESSNDQSPAKAKWLLIGWTIIGGLAINLHLISLLSISLQAMGLIGAVAIAWRGNRLRLGGQVAVCLGLLLLTALPVVWLSKDVWGRREQWSIFAGEASLARLVNFYPLLPILVPVLIAICLSRLWLGPSKPVSENRERSFSRTELVFWSLAALGPLVVGFVVTGLGIAPLMHARYLLAAAMPIVIFGGGMLAFLIRPWLQWVCCCVTLAWILWLQGTAGMWQQGYLIGPLRGEGWRQAVAFIESERKARSAGDVPKPITAVWCDGGLIEASSTELPLSHAENAYLSFPLRGAYPIAIEKLALVGEAEDWAEMWFDFLVARQESVGEFWLVRRGSAERLGRELKKLDQFSAREERIETVLLGEIRSFGRIAVARIQVRKTSKTQILTETPGPY